MSRSVVKYDDISISLSDLRDINTGIKGEIEHELNPLRGEATSSFWDKYLVWIVIAIVIVAFFFLKRRI